jgi:hypothetical protein
MASPITTVLYKGKRVPISEYLEAEHEQIQAAIIQFHRRFSELEVAASALLHAILNGKKSHVPYAIYYSVNSFEARMSIVQNALIEFVSEHKDDLGVIVGESCWPYMASKIRKIREIRNALAHGTPNTLYIGARAYVRVVPPVFDVIRISRRIANREIPGLKWTDIWEGGKPMVPMVDCLDHINRILTDYHQYGPKPPTLPDRLFELEGGLQALRSLYQAGQKQGAPSPPR